MSSSLWTVIIRSISVTDPRIIFRTFGKADIYLAGNRGVYWVGGTGGGLTFLFILVFPPGMVEIVKM